MSRSSEPLTLPPGVEALGYAGLLPQLGTLALAIGSDQGRWSAVAVGFGYAALIFSFLGGVWWGLALLPTSDPPAKPRSWIFVVGVIPSLAALVLWLPWMLGWTWPGPELACLGVLIATSPIVDRQLATTMPLPAGWLVLRYRLSGALGIMTVLLALLA